MKSEALIQARRRLQKMEVAVDELMSAKSVEETRQSWSDFLLAANAVYTKLQRGVNRSGLEQDWFKELLQERQDDELLKYIAEARNVDEHGIVEVTADTGRSSIHMMPDGTYAGTFTDNPEDIEVVSFQITLLNSDGTEMPYHSPAIAGEYAVLVDIVDDRNGRKGQVYKVPTKHFGIDIPQSHPRDIAKLALPYFQNILFVAENTAFL